MCCQQLQLFEVSDILFVFSASVEQLRDWTLWGDQPPSWLIVDEHEEISVHPELSPSIKRFLCSKCGKAYLHKPTLRRHILYECGKEPQFNCPYCPYQTKRNSNLLRHIRSARHKHVQSAVVI
jgi:DNA-directed RNA polymerase subunit RPC12/RpoP